jgi:hypothetical protein
MERLTRKADYRYLRYVAQEQQEVCWRKEATLTAATTSNVFLTCAACIGAAIASAGRLYLSLLC